MVCPAFTFVVAVAVPFRLIAEALHRQPQPPNQPTPFRKVFAFAVASAGFRAAASTGVQIHMIHREYILLLVLFFMYFLTSLYAE